MRNRLLVPLSMALGLVLAACGGSSGSPSSSGSATTVPSGPTTTVHVAEQAKNTPSISAKMICEAEAENDIYEQATGVKTVAPFHPTWIDHIYSCDYVYPGGATMTLSVKEVSSVAETTAYFDALGVKLHRTSKPFTGLGQGAFQVANGSMVIRKDYKILLIDVSKLPANFGVPSDVRGNVAIDVAEAILGCWTGA